LTNVSNTHKMFDTIGQEELRVVMFGVTRRQGLSA